MQYWEELKKWMSENGGCVECGCKDVRLLEADHVRGQKEYELSDYYYWSCNGGVEAMKYEFFKRMVECRCRWCHRLQPTHDGSRGADLSTLKAGSSAWNSRKYLDDKHAYNLKLKKEIGGCQEEGCKRKVTTKNARAFDWAHKEEINKSGAMAKICNTGSTLETCQPKMDKIRKECRLLCCNCHKLETLERLKEGKELLELLIEDCK
jgi:hypothetical protein